MRHRRAAQGTRSSRAAFVTWPLLLALLVASPAQATVIIKKAGAGPSAQLAQALSKAVGNDPRILELSGDPLADAARVARETRGDAVLYAIGPDAAEVVGEARGAALVSLAVPNPARVRTPGAYVSMYPRLDRVFSLLKERLGARQVGLLFSPNKNREVALTFLDAAKGSGVNVLPVPVSSSGDLVRELKGALPKIDVLVLLVDLILFDQQSLEFIVSETRAAKKPTVGFLDELVKLGVTLSIVAPPASVAAAAVDAAKAPVKVGKKRVEVEGAAVSVSKKAAEAVGLNTEALGAQVLP